MGEKLGRPILSPPRQDKTSALCRWLSGWRKTWLVRYFPILTSESINLTLSWICKQPLLIRGWGKTGLAILSPPRQDKASTLCRWLSGCRKTQLVRYFPTLTSESINLTLSWIQIQPLLIRGWGKTGPAQSFPTLTSESINLVQELGYLGGGKSRLVRYFSTLTSESINLTLSWIHIQPLLIRGWGKTGPAQSFPTLKSESINLVQKLGYLGGEILGGPILSPPRLVKVSTLPCHEYANNHCFLRGGEKLGQPILSPPRQDKASTWCRWLSGWEKLGWSVTFPPWQVKASTLPCHEYANNLCLLGGGEKLGRPILSQTLLVKVSILCRWLSGWRKTWLVNYFPTLTSESINLTLSWIKNNLCLLGGGEKLGRLSLSAPWLVKVSILCRS